MKARGRISRRDGDLVVVLPEECDFAEGEEVEVRREPDDAVAFRTAEENGWSSRFLASLGSIDEEIPRPPHHRLRSRDPFDR